MLTCTTPSTLLCPGLFGNQTSISGNRFRGIISTCFALNKTNVVASRIKGKGKKLLF